MSQRNMYTGKLKKGKKKKKCQFIYINTHIGERFILVDNQKDLELGKS